jgi:hypothetical protein
MNQTPVKLLGWDDLKERGIKDSKANLPQGQSGEVSHSGPPGEIARVARA